MIGELNSAEPTANTKRFIYGNGVATDYRYDKAGRLTGIDHSSGQALAYRYDKVGRIIGIDRNGAKEHYRYDTLGRLTGANTPSGKYQYRYDAVGNRTEQTENGKTTRYSYSAEGKGNRLLTTSDGSPKLKGEVSERKSNAYNVAGSPTAISKRSYTYNAEQRPTILYIDGKLAAKYAYNGFGERIKKVVYKNGEKPKVTYYFYDGQQLTAEANEDGDIIAQYIYLAQQLVAKLEGRDIYALHTDHLGTPQAATDKDGELVWAAKYTPFGKANISIEEITLNVRFPGQYEDQESGTYYNYFRDYDPEVGRYITSDPIGLAAGLNTYAYVGGNPINHVDPLGLYDIFIGGNNDDDSRIVNSYFTDFTKLHPDRNTAYFTWNQQSEIIALVNKIRAECGDDEPINLVGHSWGGATAANVAEALGKDGVDLLITIDPVSRIWSRPGDLSDNVGTWIDVNATPSDGNASDLLARLGGKWGDWPDGRADDYYTVDANHENFRALMEAAPSSGGSAATVLGGSPAGDCSCLNEGK